MRPDDRSPKGSARKTRHPRERRQDPRAATQAPRAWTGKTMHHPATRVGEIKHGRQ
jgi:hypothetical protein